MPSYLQGNFKKVVQASRKFQVAYDMDFNLQGYDAPVKITHQRLTEFMLPSDNVVDIIV